MAVCPECEADVELDEYDVDKGEIISCPECGVELEVVGLSPLELDIAPEDEDEWWPCELDCHPETMDEHPGLRWHCRGSYVLVPPAQLPGDLAVTWLRGPEHPLPDPLTMLEFLTDECARYVGAEPERLAWPLRG